MKNFFLVMLFFQQGYFFCSDKLSILDANNSKKLSELSIPQKLISAAKGGNEDEFRNIMKDKNFHKISQQDLGSCLTCAAQNGRTNIIDLIKADPKSNKIIASYLGSVLIASARKNQQEIIESIMKSQSSNSIASSDLGVSLEFAGSNDNQTAVRYIMNSQKYYQIPSYYLDSCLKNAITNDHENIAALMMNHSRFYELSKTDLIDLLVCSIKNNKENMTKLMIENIRIFEIELTELGDLLIYAAKHGYEKIVDLMIHNRRFSQIDISYLKAAFIEATKNGHEKIFNLMIKTQSKIISNSYLMDALYDVISKKDVSAFKVMMKYEKFDDVISNQQLRVLLRNEILDGHENIVKLIIESEKLDERDYECLFEYLNSYFFRGYMHETYGTFDYMYTEEVERPTSYDEDNKKRIVCMIKSKIFEKIYHKLILNCNRLVLELVVGTNRFDVIDDYHLDQLLLKVITAFDALSGDIALFIAESKRITKMSDSLLNDFFIKAVRGEAEQAIVSLVKNDKIFDRITINSLEKSLKIAFLHPEIGIFRPIICGLNFNQISTKCLSNYLKKSSSYNIIKLILDKRPDKRPFILDLIKTNARREVEQDLFEQMGISKKDLFEREIKSATKIQALYKGYKVRSDLFKE